MILESALLNEIVGDLRYWPVMGAATSMFVLGLVDDFRNLQARLKAAIQFAAALLVVAMGFRFRVVLVPFGDGALELGILSVPLTLAWIIGVTNAMNLIDGMDGLAAGVTFWASLAFGIFFIARNDLSSAVICFGLAGAVAGFLIYNRPRAKIFMGDSGSLFIGFTLAVLPLLHQTETYAEIGLISAVCVLGIPIFDTLWAIFRRTRARVSFLTPDRGHMHHRFLDLGYTVPAILAHVYSGSILLGLAALSTLVVPAHLSFTVKISALVILFAKFLRLARMSDAAGCPCGVAAPATPRGRKARSSASATPQGEPGRATAYRTTVSSRTGSAGIEAAGAQVLSAPET